MQLFPQVTERNRHGLSVLVGFITVGFYALASELAMRSHSRLLPLTAFDQAVPLEPWTFWIYSTVYLIFFTSCFFQRDLERLRRFFILYMVAYAAAGVWFVLVPTRFPRELYPLPADGSFTVSVFQLFRRIDHPTNCLPSMHVASAVMSTLPFLGRRPRFFVVYCFWSLAIALTTLTTKQHYAIDVLAGVLYGIASSILVYAFLERLSARETRIPDGEVSTDPS